MMIEWHNIASSRTDDDSRTTDDDIRRTDDDRMVQDSRHEN